MNTTKVFASSIPSRFFWVVCAWVLLGLPEIGSAFTAGKLVTVSNHNLVDVPEAQDSTVTRVIVPIHGWYGVTAVAANYYGADKYLNSEEWLYAFSEIDASLAGTNYKLAAYAWAKDSATLSAVTACQNSSQHGSNLSETLNTRFPNLREVHLIAHSAGTWAACSASENLLRLNPYVVVQITLLDPYVPEEPNLTTTKVNIIPFVSNSPDRIFLLDHYVSFDGLLDTDNFFTWRPTDAANVRVDYTTTGNVKYYDGHSEPIRFYADTVQYARTGYPPLALLDASAPFHSNWRNEGWGRSLFKQRSNRPQVAGILLARSGTTPALPQTAYAGESITLTGLTSRATSYQWFRNGAQISGATTAILSLSSVSPLTSSGTYVLRASSTTQGAIFSNAFTLSILEPTQTPTPQDPLASLPLALTSVSPSTIAGTYGTITLKGSNFLDSTKLEFVDPSNVSYVSLASKLSRPDSKTLVYNVTVGSGVGIWKVRVLDPPRLPTSFLTFSVTAPPPVAPPTATTGSLQVSLSPSSAIGAQWSVSGRVSRNSGETEPGLPPGTATVRFTPVSGYNTPADRTVTITAGNTASTSATYTALAPANYMLTLNSVNGAIGRNPDASNYPAGTVVRIWASANSGYHFVNWSGDLSGSSTVADIVMTGNKNITANFAAGDWSKTSLAVSILPAEVLTLGAQWRVDGGSWQNSGVIIPDQHLGDNVVEFREVPGWYKPATQRIILQGGQPAVISGTYTRDVTPGILQVAINPPDAAAAGGQWQVNGGAWQSHATSLSLAPGSYTVSFKPVATWGTPPSRTVVVPNGATANVNASYEVPLGQPTIFSVSPLFGPIAGGTILTIDGANFGQNSSVTIGGVAAASVTVIDSTQLLATTPAATSTGTAPIVVTSGAVSTPSNAFSYSASQGAGMQLLSSIGGTAMAVASNANNVFIGEGANLVVTSTSSTARIGSVLIPGLIQDIVPFTRSGRNYVCIAANAAGLQIVDVTTPTSPILVSSVAINGTASGVATSGTLAYVSAYEGRLMIVDLSAPGAPIKRSELVMTQGASDVAVRTSVAGVYCYMPSGTDLLVVQADLPTAPTFLRSISGPTADLFDNKRTITISEAGAYVSLNGGISVFDLSSSAFPTFVQYKTGLNNNSGGALAAAGGYLYEATRGWGISTYSISPSGISLLHYTPSIACDSGNGISISSSKAFVAGGDSGTNYFSLSSPTAPTHTITKPVSGTCWAVDVSDNLAITACNKNGATIYNVSSPQNPLVTALSLSPSPGFQLFDVKLRGRNGYLLYNGNAKFHYLNLTNPALPVNSGSFDYVTYSPNSFDVVDNRVFLAGGGPNYSAGARLGIINGGFGSTSISSDFSVFPGGWVRSVAGFGNVAAVGMAGQGAKFVDAGNGTVFSSVHPGETIRFTNFSPTGEYCYLGSDSGFYIYDVRNINAPIKVFETAASYPRISSSGSKVAFTSDRLVKILDVTIPSTPVQVASQSCLDYTTGIKMTGDLVYVANYEAGMSIYRLNDATAPEVFITNPVFASTYETEDSQIDIAGVVTDDRQVASIGWSNDTGGGAAGTFSLDSWQIDAIPLRIGPNELTVTAVDTSGNVGRDTITVFRSGVKQTQTLTFIAPPIQTFGGPPLPLVATSSSALPVTFSIVSGPASIVGSTLTTSGAGTVMVRATQAGNWDYSAATPMDRSFTVDKSPQLIAWTAIGDKIYGDPTFTLSAQATSGQAVTYSVVSGPATVTGTQCTLTGQGVVVLNASQAGSANYLPTSENISFSVFGTPQTLSFGNLAQQVVGASAFPLVAVSSSGQPVTYSVLSGPAELIEGKLHLIGPGVVIVRAYAPGTNSLASATVDQMFAVVPGVNLISDFQKMENDRAYFRFWGEQNRDYDIQSSPDLKTWTTLSTERVNSFGYIEHTGEPVGTTPKTFYRVKW